MYDFNKWQEFMDKQPEHCGADAEWKTCPVLQAFRCPDKFICKGCEFMRSEEIF